MGKTAKGFQISLEETEREYSRVVWCSVHSKLGPGGEEFSASCSSANNLWVGQLGLQTTYSGHLDRPDSTADRHCPIPEVPVGLVAAAAVVDDAADAGEDHNPH
jgi:hypothetical protein